MSPDDLMRYLDVFDRVTTSPKALTFILYIFAPFLSYVSVQQVKKYIPAIIGRRMTDFEVRGVAWVFCFLFAYIVGTHLFDLTTSRMVIHGFLIAVIYERFIKLLFKWAGAHSPVLLATLRNDRRERSVIPPVEERRQTDTEYTRY